MSGTGHPGVPVLNPSPKDLNWALGLRARRLRTSVTMKMSAMDATQAITTPMMMAVFGRCASSGGGIIGWKLASGVLVSELSVGELNVDALQRFDRP